MLQKVVGEVSGVSWDGMGTMALAAIFLGAGKAVGTLGHVVLVPRMVARCLSAVSCALLIGWNGAAGLGFRRAEMRSWAAWWAASAEAWGFWKEKTLRCRQFGRTGFW